MDFLKNFSKQIFANEAISKSIDDCNTLQLIGVYLIAVFVLSIISNSILLWIFIVTKRLRKPTDILIISLTLSNLLGTVIFMPFIIISNFTCG
jgi:hypothetical protein